MCLMEAVDSCPGQSKATAKALGKKADVLPVFLNLRSESIVFFGLVNSLGSREVTGRRR